MSICAPVGSHHGVLTDKDIGNGILACLIKQVLLNSYSLFLLVYPEE
jgi:hypothetical protein